MRRRSSTAWYVFLVAASIALAALVLVLSLQNRALKEALARERERGDPAAEGPRFAPGDALPPIALRRSDGSVASLAFGAHEKTMLFFYAEACPICVQAFTKWEELAALAGASVQVAAIQLDAAPASERSLGPQGLPSYVLADVSAVPLAKLSAVPITLLVDGRGVVEYAHYGTLTVLQMGDLAALLPEG